MLAGATKWYVATDGDDGDDGSISNPFATINEAYNDHAGAGDTIYVRGGTYELTAKVYLTKQVGSSGALINIWNYPGELPKITRASGSTFETAFDIRASYIYLKGFEIYGITQLAVGNYYGILCYNVKESIFENLNIHHTMYGLAITDFGADSTGNIWINNVDCWWMEDPESTTPYTSGNGFDLHVDHFYGKIYYNGCRNWWCCDDGWDFFNGNGITEINNCWAFWNGFIPGTFTSPVSDPYEGHGFKIGDLRGDSIDLTQFRHIITNCLAIHNEQNGFDQNAGYTKYKLYNNVAAFNLGHGYSFAYGVDAGLNIEHDFANNISYANGTSAGRSESNAQFRTNTFVHPGGAVYAWIANTDFTVDTSDFNIDTTGISGARKANGDLPDINLFRLKAGSDLIDAGTDVGLFFYGDAPDLGAFEYVPPRPAKTPGYIVKGKLLRMNGKLIR